MIRQLTGIATGLLTSMLILLVPTEAVAQREVGQLAGVVTSAETGAPLTAVQVSIVGTSIGALTGPDGRFTLSNVPVGTHEVVAQRIGLQEARQADVSVTAGGATSVNFA